MTIEKLDKALAVIDSEWTDGAPATARLVSIAIARHEPNGTMTSGYWLVNPGTPISAEATEVHGITNKDVADKPVFEKVAPEVAALLTDCDIGGYGVRSDLQLVEREMEIAGIEWSPAGAAIIDGLRMWQILEPRKLEDAHKRFVGPVPDTGKTHHADFDVELTTAVIAALRRGRPIREIHEETNGDMVDVAGKFRLDQGKRIVLAFGPYRGAVASDHPDFLQWMLSKDFPRSTLDVARRIVNEQYQEEADAVEIADDDERDADISEDTDRIPF